MTRLPHGPTFTGDDASAARSDLPRPYSRAAKGRRGTRGAAAALGAVALTSGVTAAIDAARDGTQISAGRLAITLTAHGGFKLDTCTTNGSSNSPITSSTTQDLSNSITISDSTQTSGTGSSTSDTTQTSGSGSTTSDTTQTSGSGSTTSDTTQLSVPNEYNNLPPQLSIYQSKYGIWYRPDDTEGLPLGFSRSGTMWIGGDENEVPDFDPVPPFDGGYSNEELNVGPYQPNAGDGYDPSSISEYYMNGNNENIDNDRNGDNNNNSSDYDFDDPSILENVEFKMKIMTCEN
ncbi:MAG: hypothetical protein K2X56_05460 [Mycobacterium pseudokansasii]|uniref:hypothetical protein n=1 Tax=Mycobacterium pseudokansasii TaxID=2341080 RepID=UPI0023F2F8AC|nr:hypothetical protein [Mycobacterium pseudokansasii]MBY0387552.1 hypothetical protein [Mycobacterium pseudokansasii]